MKRIGQNIWNDICNPQNIEGAIYDAVKAKKEEFLLENIDHYIEEIHTLLITETYEFHPLKHMITYDPKERIIDYSITYPDKVLINCVLRCLKTRIIPKYIENTYSSIKGRGMHSCSKRIKRGIRKYPDAFYLQTDIRKYYNSINQVKCKGELRKYIKDKKLLRFLDKLIDNHSLGIPIGISLGSYMANLYMTGIDRWVYEELKPLMYTRYMDDQLMLFETKEEAHEALRKLKEKLKEYDLDLKNNERIAPVKNGISMIGYVFFPTHTKLRKNIKKSIKKKAKQIKDLNGNSWKQQMASYYGWCMHADCKNFMRKTFGLNKYNLFMENNYKRLKDIQKDNNFFGLPRESRVSITELIDRDIVLFEYQEVTIRGESKLAVRFKYPDDEEKKDYLFLTKSNVLKEKIIKNSDNFPAIVTILEKTGKGGRTYYTCE